MILTRISDPEQLRRVYRELMLESFRASELLEEAAFLEQHEHGVETLVAIADERMLGAAVVEPVGRAALLQYLVVGPAGRGQGVGGTLLDAALSRWASNPAVDIVLAEFDRPDVQTDHPLHGDPSRRLQFYARHGAVALDLPYFQPPVADGVPREYGMLLAAFGGDVEGEGALSPEQSDAVRSYLYSILAGADDADARRLASAAQPPTAAHTAAQTLRGDRSLSAFLGSRTMKIAIAGGTGQAGAQAALAARERGHEVVLLARSKGVNLVTGEGAAAALDGVDAVIDASGVRPGDDPVSFHEAVVRSITKAKPPHLVILSIVNNEHAGDYPLYLGKLAQERAARAKWHPIHGCTDHAVP